MNILDAAEKVLLERGVPMPIEKVAEIVIRGMKEHAEELQLTGSEE